MKNYCIFELAALAALTFASCSSESVEDFFEGGGNQASQQVAIGFDGYLGRSAVDTRGSVSSTEAIQAKNVGFGVFGNYTSESGVSSSSVLLFNNQHVTFETSKWTYSPVKYWPTAGHIDFLAYAPYGSNTKLTNNKDLVFSVNSVVKDQIDLLWANAADKTKTTEKVNFAFKHALAKIGYSVKSKANYASTTITVKSIKLVGSVDGKANAFYTKGTIDLSKADNKANDLWTTASDDTKQNFTLLSSNLTLNTTKHEPKDYLFVIPQDFSDTNNLYVVVEYTVKTTDNTDNIEITNTVSQKITKNFLQGKAYMINLIIGLTPIEFEATIDLWPTDESIDGIEWN